MKQKKCISKKQISALTFASIIPVCAIIFGIELLTDNFIIKTSYIISYFILPFIVTALLTLVMFSGKKRLFKVLSSVMLLFLLSIVFTATTIVEKHEQISIFKDEEIKEFYVKNDNSPMPLLSEIAQPTKLDYYNYYSSHFGIFTCDSNTLICKYNEEMYTEQKELLDKKYIFQSNTVNDYGYNDEQATELDDYSFRLLSIDDYKINYPKAVFLIATNDTENEIVYMSFYNDDLDYIESLSEFIKEDCGWVYIR